MSFNCKRCGGELDIYKEPDTPIEDKILIQPCPVCEAQTKRGAKRQAWDEGPIIEGMGR